MRAEYRDTVRLLLNAIPAVFRVPNFAMKGGTAINFFVRDMPRLSVDIDITFTRLDLSRAEALQAIAANLAEIAANLKRQGMKTRLAGPTNSPERKLFVGVDGSSASVTVEVNTVMRGTVFPVETRELASVAQEQFAMHVTAPILAPAELYGGKLVALLDRQHPRDLFDGLLLLEHQGLTDDIIQSFVVYLAGANRPAHELLKPNLKDVRQVYESDFVGMTERTVSLDELVAVRELLGRELLSKLTDAQRAFLLSMTRGEVDWQASGVAHADQLPALQWKLENIRKLVRANSGKHSVIVEKLKRLLG